jgi:hypothetical protein
MTRFTKYLLTLALCGAASATVAQTTKDFCGKLYNKEMDVVFVINLHDDGILVPGHEIHGPLPGYLGLKNSTFYWLVVDKEVEGNKATLQLVNDYGSEDLTATLQQQNDSTYRLVQGKGSVIKLPNKRKWMKLPNSMIFKKMK